MSNQCMSLVRDNCLVPTYDAPELAYVKESSSQQYVPDVFYKEKDEYGNEVTRLSRPLPVEYLIVDLPASMPIEPKYTFRLPTGKTLFPVENRIDQKQVSFSQITNFEPGEFFYVQKKSLTAILKLENDCKNLRFYPFFSFFVWLADCGGFA